MQNVTIPLTAIAVEDRLRDVDPAKAAELATSLREAGQITPIVVAPEDAKGMWRLIAGAHRVAAARIAGLVMLDARVFEGTADEARLQEIDENLYRRELSAFDQATFLAERRAIYERVFGAVKAGKRNRAKSAQLNFFDDVAERFGLGRRLVQLALWRRGSIEPAVWKRLSGSKFAEKGVVLDAIARLVPAQQARVVDELLAGRAKGVAEALVAIGATAPIDEAQKQMLALLSAWTKAGTQPREQFLNHLAQTSFSTLNAAVKRQQKKVDALKEDGQ